jgi:hypothetical protein
MDLVFFTLHTRVADVDVIVPSHMINARPAAQSDVT